MADEFLTTRWSMVLAAAHGHETAAQVAMEHLCRSAWRPLYAYARRWGCAKEDAEDAVQGFIASCWPGNRWRRWKRDAGGSARFCWQA